MKEVSRKPSALSTKTGKSVLTLSDRGVIPQSSHVVRCVDVGRIEKNYVKMGNHEKAIEYFQQSLTEQHPLEILAKLHDAEKTKAENGRLAHFG